MSTLTQIRSAYLDFFASKNHIIMPSSALVPHNDPTLMFTNAGMNQFKNVFTGIEQPPSPPRATTAQKCVRAGGKHNDLDNVGYTTRHHTFFEMMGNFSFADYFKEEAIAYAWELLTGTFNLPKDKLYFTVYHTDDEAFAIWKKVTGCEDGRILRVPTNDNFWSMGDVGPCGPCSEIFFDHGEGLNGQWALDSTGHDLFDARYVEIWNLVFMQYEQLPPLSSPPPAGGKEGGRMVNLPKPCVDTGMGLERMATVLQGKRDNYDIDLFTHLIEGIKEFSKTREITPSHKVIADHLRSTCFLMADGVLPSNEGRGYVLRRIMRRAMRHAHLLGCKEPLMYKLVPSLIQEMGAHYTELGRAQALMTETLKSEEVRFKETLERGLKLLDEEIVKTSPHPNPLPEGEGTRTTSPIGRGRNGEAISGEGILSGEVAFKLYDTFGFPLDLTQDILRGHNMAVDQDGFDAAMNAQKARARAAWKGSGESAVQEVWFDIRDESGATEFIGYAQHSAQALVTAIVKDGARVNALKAGESGLVVTNQTPFYGESGGQTGDVGTLEAGAAKATITATTKPIAELHAHHAALQSGSLKVGDTVTLSIDEATRTQVKAHHSATHLLHAALREVLGAHVTQKGSLVEAQRLRFDISHPKALSPEEILAVEQRVNAMIWQNAPVKTELMAKDDAIAAGAMAMFGEKYADEVRVLSMGITGTPLSISPLRGEKRSEATQKGVSKAFSVELCGGTHVSATGDIGLFKLISESAIAAGVRRIEGLAGGAAFAYLAGREAMLRSAALQLNAQPDEVADKIAKLQADKKQLEKELVEAKKQLAMGGNGGAGDAPAELDQVAGIAFLGKAFGELPPKELRDIATSLAQKHENAVIAVASACEGKASVIIATGKALVGVDASALIKSAVPIVAGQGGGGKPNFAQCGGADGSKISDAIAAIKAALASHNAA